MASLPSLLLLLTTAQLLFGEGQAAYLQEPENPGTFQQDSPAGSIQYYEPFRSYPLKEVNAEYQIFGSNGLYQPQNELGSPNTAQAEGLFSEAEIAAVCSNPCIDEYKAQLKKLEEMKRQYNAQLNNLEDMKKAQLKLMENMKKTCNSAGLHDCCQVKKLLPKAKSGIFNFEFFCGGRTEPFSSLRAPCDMNTDSGGWMVIQRRLPSGTVNFTRKWQDYVNGFGDLHGEFWYGLRNLHCLTAREEVELRIDMVTKKTKTTLWWTYQTFKVAGAGDKYRLTIGGAKGSAWKDAMAHHNGMQFSTYDQDNDKFGGNCAYYSQGGWWYNNCHSNLNGPHNTPSWAGVDQNHARITWWDGAFHQLSSVEMKIRAKKCHG